MTNSYSLPFLLAQAKHEGDRIRLKDERKWVDLSPFEQNRLKREADQWINAMELVDPRMVKKRPPSDAKPTKSIARIVRLASNNSDRPPDADKGST